jgi:hypothetical protein
MAKIFVSIDATDEKRAAVAKHVADALGVPVEDVVLVPAGCNVSVVDVPAQPKRLYTTLKAAEHAAKQS